MDREEYADFMEVKNGYCECPELKELLSLRKICSSLIDQSKIEEAKKPIMKYHAKLSVLLHKGEIEAILHKASDLSSMIKLAYGEIDETNISENIVTVHCARCGQQIDVLG